MIGTEDLVEILGPRPWSKSVDYDAFINASWAPVGDEGGNEGGGEPATDGEAASPAQGSAEGAATAAAAVREVPP